MKRGALALAAVLVVTLIFAGQGAASAASGRIKAIDIGMNAPVKKVGVKKGGLAIGNNPHTVYTWKHGDPPCDPTGNTVYTGHAWKKGDGVADKWGKLRKGDIIRVGGCKHKVTKVQYRSATRSIKKLYRVDGPAGLCLVGCKHDDYSKITVVCARLVS